MNQTTELSQQQVLLRWMHLVLAVLAYKNIKGSKPFQKDGDISILLNDIKVGRSSGYYPKENLWGIMSTERETLARLIQLDKTEVRNFVEYGQFFAMKRLYSIYQEEEQVLFELFDEVCRSQLWLAA